MSRSHGRRVIVAAVLAGLLGASGAWAQGAWQAPAAEKTKKNPVPGGAKAVEAGKKVAQVNCVLCHGESGKGNGSSSTALTTLKSVVVAPMPSARVSAAVAANPGARPSRRKPWNRLRATLGMAP